MNPDADAQEAALPFRVYGLEGRMATADDAIARLNANDQRKYEVLSDHTATLAKHSEQLSTTRDDQIALRSDYATLAGSVVRLAEKVTETGVRVAWTLTGFAFTVAASILVLILTRPPS